MRYFPLLDFQHVVLALFLGAIALIFAWAAWGGYARRGRSEEESGGDGVVPESGHAPVPPILFFVYGAVAVGAIGYALFVRWSGAPVGY